MSERCPECGSREYYYDGDWDDDGNQTAEYMLCHDCSYSGPVTKPAVPTEHDSEFRATRDE